MKRKLLYSELTYQIRKVIFDVYNRLGPIFKEATYEKAMIIGLCNIRIPVNDQVQFQLFYKSSQVGYYIADLLVDNKIILELKAVPTLLPVHRAQLISYLKVTDKKLGLLINFGDTRAVIETYPNVDLKKEGKGTNGEIKLKENLHFPDLTKNVLNAMFEIHHTLGPGFFPHVYRRSARIEFELREISFEIIKKIQAQYLDEIIDEREIRFLIIDDKLGLEIVTVNQITELQKHQMWSYLINFNLQLGLIVNFNSMPLEFQFIYRKGNRD